MPDINLIPHPLTGTPFGAALDLCLIVAVVTYLASLVTRNYAWIDRRWEVVPPVCCLIVAAAADFESARLNLMTALVIAWSLRLAHTCWRKGGHWKGDYRWTYIRLQMHPISFVIYHMVFVALGHICLIWLFTAPLHQAWLERNTPLNGIDLAAAVLFLAFFIGEAVADQQMWAFQQDKKRRNIAGEEGMQPFMNTGLWRYCRHPNYLCELGMWWVFYLFSVAASGQWVNWTGLGFVLLTAVFVGSVRLTESISAERYPSYRDYQASTPALIPGPRLRRR